MTIESWTDAFNIFTYVLRQSNKSNSDFSEDLAIYMDLVRSIQKDWDGGGGGAVITMTCRFASVVKQMIRFLGVKWIKYYTVGL